LLKNIIRTVRGSSHTASPVNSGAGPSRPPPSSSGGGNESSVLKGAPKRPHGAGEQSSPVRSQLPPPQHDAQPPRFAAGSLGALLSLGNASPVHSQHHAEPTGPAAGGQLGALLSQETQQQEAAKAQRAQLMQAALPDGGRVMERLTERARRRKPTTRAEKWHSFTTGAPKPMEGKRRLEFQSRVNDDVRAIARTGGMRASQAAETMRTAVREGIHGQGIRPADRELLLQVLDEVINPTDRLYKEQNLRLTTDTQHAYTDNQLLETPTKLGTGNANLVFEVKLQEPDGGTFNGIFKPLVKKQRGYAAALTGIPRNDPQTAMRNLGTLAYAKKLGMDVIVDTRIAIIDPEGDGLSPALGMVMKRAQGRPGHAMDVATLRRADVTMELTKLQLLDHLTGQGDRSPTNYFIDIGPDGAKVTGIDNDQCFGKDLHDPAGIQQIPDDNLRRNFRGTGLPPVVDTNMALSISVLTERDIRLMLGDKLGEAEIQAALSRHDGLKKHIVELESLGNVIDPVRWGDYDIQGMLKGDNSYVGRDRDYAQAKQDAREELARQAQQAAANNNG
jgi:hypothetical protein